MGNSRKALVTLAIVIASGKLEKQPLFDTREQKSITRPKISRQTGSNEMIIFAEKGKKYKFGKIVF